MKKYAGLEAQFYCTNCRQPLGRKSDPLCDRCNKARTPEFYRPKGVPQRATAKVCYNKSNREYELRWEWQQMDGNWCFYNQCVTIDKYAAHDGTGRVIDQWHAVYDPDTNEHLGDYRVLNGKTEIRNPSRIGTEKVYK